MALVPCPECTNKISNKAEACPQCGFPLKEAKRKKAAKRRKKQVHDRKRVKLRNLITDGKVLDDDVDLRQRTVEHARRVDVDMEELREIHLRHWELKIALTRADDPSLRVDDPVLKQELVQLQSSLKDWRRRLGIWCEHLPSELAYFGVIAIELAGRTHWLDELDYEDSQHFADFCSHVLLDYWDEVEVPYCGFGPDFWALELDEDWS